MTQFHNADGGAVDGTDAVQLSAGEIEGRRQIRDDVRNRMRSIYFQAIGTTPEGLANMMRDEVERWGKVIKQTGANAD